MNEYTFYQDHKGTIWQRSHFSVNAESLNEAKQIIAANNLSSNFVGDLDDGQTIVFHKSEYLYDTLSSMVPDHNQGHATIIVLDSNHYLHERPRSAGGPICAEGAAGLRLALQTTAPQCFRRRDSQGMGEWAHTSPGR